MDLSDQDKRLIFLLQGDLPVTERPFDWLAGQAGISEEKVLDRLRAFEEAGLLRRFGATLYHQRTGFQANVMVAWQVAPERTVEVGRALAKNKAVSHCYQRQTAPDWPFNLYTMVHGESDEEVRELVERMAQAVEVDQYRLLFSVEELKKTTMRYFA